jgi:predicted phage gp36 major capsid-like protein
MAEHFQAEFAEWRRECELIDREMDRIASARLSGAEDERQVRKFQFASLVERRNDAARKLLSRRGVIKRVRPSA